MKKFSLIVLLLQITVAGVFGQADWREKVSPEIQALGDRREPADVIVVFRDQADLSGARRLATKSEKARFVYDRLTATAARSQERAVRLLREKNAAVNGLFLVNALAVQKADAALIRELAQMNEVKWVGADPWVQFEGSVETTAAAPAAERGTVEWGVQRIKAPDVWAKGYTGQGITIGGADTGYDWLHPTLQPHYRGYSSFAGITDHNYNWHDAIHDYSPLNLDSLGNPVGTNPCGFNTVAPCADGAHGTHTMGTMIGDDGLGNQIGVAPGASWIGCRNMERGWGQPSTYLECFQWFLAPTDLNGQNPNPGKAPHVINNSWYCAYEEGCTDMVINDLLRVAIVNLKASGVFVVVSNGNFGNLGCASVTIPAIFEESFSIGAIQYNDSIAGFSSLGPVVTDGNLRIKPNVSAPGQDVRSSVPNGNFANFSGTSMSGPHVAGLVALVLSAQPKLIGQVEVLENLIETTAIPAFDQRDCSDNGGQAYPNNTYGFGKVNALDAVNAALLYNPTPVSEAPAPVARIFPNPVDKEAVFDLQNTTGRTVLEVYAPDGKAVFSKTWTTQGYDLVPVSLEAQPGGVYFWQLRAENGVITGKVIKN